jgi:hypothetical protein
MAALPKTRERALPDEGEHILKLTEARIKRIDSKFPDGKEPDGKADVLIWNFQSNLTTEDGEPQELDLLTPPSISEKNKTGRLAKMLSPGLDIDTDDFDPEDYIGKRFSAFIIHEERNGRTYAWPAKLKPYVKAAKAGTKPAKPADEEEDAFADE